MNLSRWPGADRILEEALDRPASERAAFIREAAGGDEALVSALAAVLREEVAGEDGFLAPGGALAGPIGAELQREADEEEREGLAPGTRIGDYEIAGVLGRGGMGEVYRAQDLKLRRDVAMKVLPHRFANDPDRLGRFRREARFLASLNHPNIGAIYGVAESDTVEALVLELVEGPTLAERIATKPLSTREALALARQLAAALEAAHRIGVVHRDLKPANLKVTGLGQLKVLDFGLARVVSIDEELVGPAPAARPSSLVEDHGLIVGTAAYMSPEQARGLPVDQRADVWAFGCIVFEMLTGRRVFDGATVAETFAALLEREPDYTLLPADLPDEAKALLRRCLEKDPRRRLGYIGDAVVEIDEALRRVDAPRGLQHLRRIPLRAAVVTALVALAVVAALMFLRRQTAEEPTVTRLAVPLPPEDALVAGSHPLVALSPDGRTLVYRAERNGVIQLFQRSLGELQSTAIPGSENGASPFFSPDGRWLGFDADGTLKKLSLAGGAPVAVTHAPGGAAAHWADGQIVFSTPTLRTLYRVSPEGGDAVPLTRLDERRGELGHAHPFIIPGGRAILFTIVRNDAREIGVLSTDTGKVTVLTHGMQPRLLPSGHLLFARESVIWAARFDRRRLALQSQPVPVLDNLELNDIVYFATADDGTLVYVPRRAPTSGRTLSWFDRQGAETPVPLPPRPYLRATLSPDGARVALAIQEEQNTDVWVADLHRGSSIRLTSHPTVDTAPLWSPDGRFVVFRSEREGGGLFRRAADGTSDVQRITRGNGPYHTPYSWLPDGRTLLFAELEGYRLQRIRTVSLDSGSVQTLLDGPFAQLRPRVSPNGRWLAYQSDESGRFEVYVRPYPELRAGRWQISLSGGTSPRWSHDSSELFYYDGEAIVSVRVGQARTALEAGEPRRIFPVRPFAGRLGPDFDVSRAGRFLMINDAPPTDPVARRAQLVLVQNWARELGERVP